MVYGGDLDRMTIFLGLAFWGGGGLIISHQGKII